MNMKRVSNPATTSHFVIERCGVGSFEWHVIAHPANDVVKALDTLQKLHVDEQTKRYKGKLRLVKVTRCIVGSA